LTASRLGVLGWPVAHSRSPEMHNAALDAVGLSHWRYQHLPVPPELLAITVRALRGAGFAGANVTIPHKASALALSDSASERAMEIGAANTLILHAGGQIEAENTDALALVRLLGDRARGREVLLLGAGGSARAGLWALRAAGAAEVRVWNRTPAAATALCAALGGVPVADRRALRGDVLVNCTPVGMGGPRSGPADRRAALKDLPIGADELTRFQTVVDFAYGDIETPLVRAARAAGAHVIDGLELLLWQGAEAFERFTGRVAPIAVMRAALSGSRPSGGDCPSPRAQDS
jgi:shikimate dehydrogenase